MLCLFETRISYTRKFKEASKKIAKMLIGQGFPLFALRIKFFKKSIALAFFFPLFSTNLWLAFRGRPSRFISTSSEKNYYLNRTNF